MDAKVNALEQEPRVDREPPEVCVDLFDKDDADSRPSTEETATQAAAVLEQCRRRGVTASLHDTVEATRIRTFLLDLEDDLSQVNRFDEALRRMIEMSLETSGVTIQAPLPDSRFVAVHVPKKATSATVRMPKFIQLAMDGSMRIPCVLGEDYRGEPVLVDLSTDCHQLVGGQTGSGKSMLLKAMILSMACGCPPEDLKLIIVDGKGLDLSCFADLPHCACPVITDMTQAKRALKWLAKEMDRRRAILREAKVLDIWRYNSRVAEQEDDEASTDSIPAIVVIIDEVQTLVNGGVGETDELLRHLSQQGRACGIFLILSTQRPSVDILQGSTKANIPGRISLRLPSQADSRVILDQGGAELLRGAGDLIAIESSLGVPSRFQAPLVTDDEIRRVCEHFAGAPDGSLHDLSVAIAHGRSITVLGCQPEIGAGQTPDDEDAPATGQYSSSFAKVALDEEAARDLLTAETGSREAELQLVYLPFIYGRIASGWRAKHILFEPTHGYFVTSLCPLVTVPLWKRTAGLNGELDLFRRLIRRRAPISEASISEICDEAQEQESSAALWRLVERGLVSPKSDRFSVAADVVTVPRLDDRFTLSCAPRHGSAVHLAPHDLDDRIGHLRHDLAAYWHTPLDNVSLIGMPFYRITGISAVPRLASACQGLSRRTSLDGIALDDAVGGDAHEVG